MKLHTRTVLATIALGATASALAIAAPGLAMASSSTPTDGTSNTVNFSWGESQVPLSVVRGPLGYTFHDVLISS